jgi:hypothetical protein
MPSRGVRCVVRAVARVRRLPVDGCGDRLVEEELPGMDDPVVADVRLHVDVRGPARIPAGEHAQESGVAGRIGALVAAEVARARRRPAAASRSAPARPGVEAGVVPEGVAVPDLDVGASDRLARPRAHDRQLQDEGQTRLALADVAAGQVLVDPVRPFSDLGREDAGGGGAGVGAQRVDRSRAEGDGEAGAARGPDQCAATEGSVLVLGGHAATVQTRPETALRIACSIVRCGLSRPRLPSRSP